MTTCFAVLFCKTVTYRFIILFSLSNCVIFHSKVFRNLDSLITLQFLKKKTVNNIYEFVESALGFFTPNVFPKFTFFLTLD